MSTPHRRARDKDRDAAIELVEAAWAGGQIADADRDERVVDFGELSTEPTRPPTVPDDARSVARSRAVALLVALGLLGAGVVGVLSWGGSFADGSGGDRPTRSSVGPGNGPWMPPRLLDPHGYGDLLADVREVSGSTEAFEAVLYPEYAIVHLPADERTAQQELWYWDGTMVDLDSTATSAHRRFDLADVDPQVVVRLVERARRFVDGPTRSYAILRATDAEGVAIYAYATNEYREGGFIAATPTGRVVRNTFTR